jgi:SAM-dependent methyltransferase
VADPYADWKGWDPDSFGRYSATDARYFNWHLGRALPDRHGPWQVLELGFGNGGFMGWLRDGGHRVLGLEANGRLVELARSRGYEACAALDELAGSERFDLIAAFDVLEHVPVAELQALLEDLAQRLAPEGRLLLRFPNGESPFGLWMQQGDLTHVHAIGLSKVRQLCAACGLVLEHTGEPLPWQAQPPKRRPGAWLFMRLRRAFEWALRKMYQLPRGLDLSPNQLVVLSRLAQARGPVARH